MDAHLQARIRPIYGALVIRRTRRCALDAETFIQHVVNAIEDRKGVDTVALDVRGRTGYTDYVIITSATSDRQVQAIADHVASAMTALGEVPLGMEGIREGQWALIDFGHVVVHVFHQFTRDVYRLEELWRGASQVDIRPNPRLVAPAAAGQRA